MNISVGDYFLSHLKNFKNFTQEYCIAFVHYRKTFRNYLTVLTHRLSNKYPVESVLRNGESKVLRNYRDIEELLDKSSCCSVKSQAEYYVKYDEVNEIATILPSSGQTDKKNLKLYGSRLDGDIQGIFCDGVYGRLPVKGRTVLDIGANIGDSAIYFALRGANRVIALEPFPTSYKLAKINIESNNFLDKVTLKMAGCAAKTGNITIDPNYKSDVKSQLAEFPFGVKIPLLTLEQILDENNVEHGSILKIDCEGCEYDIILSTSAEILRRFAHIQIEYHFGYKNLKNKLEISGFRVYVGDPVAVRLGRGHFNMFKRSQHKKGSRVPSQYWYVGDLYAFRLQ